MSEAPHRTAAPAPAATAPTAAPVVAPAPAERIRIEIPFCGLEAAAPVAECVPERVYPLQFDLDQI